MKPKNVPVEITDALFTHELLRRMGIPADNIFIGLTQPDKVVVYIRLPGREECGIVVATTKMSPNEFLVVAKEATELWNRTGRTDSSWGFENSSVRGGLWKLTLELHMAGILPLR